MKDISSSFLTAKWSRVSLLLLWDEYSFSHSRFYFLSKVSSLILVLSIFPLFISFAIKRRNSSFSPLLINCVVDFVRSMMNNFARPEIKRFFFKNTENGNSTQSCWFFLSKLTILFQCYKKVRQAQRFTSIKL